jgi:hypothetical protein
MFDELRAIRTIETSDFCRYRPHLQKVRLSHIPTAGLLHDVE